MHGLIQSIPVLMSLLAASLTSGCQQESVITGQIHDAVEGANQGNADVADSATAIVAGGCLIRRLPGVEETRVGYSGGDVPHATYQNHGNHAEAIEITFDPQVMSYRRLLEFFFQIHDPTTANQQGNDRGPSYRSAIFYTSDEQHQIALDTTKPRESPKRLNNHRADNSRRSLVWL